MRDRELIERLRNYANNGCRPWIGIQAVFSDAADRLEAQAAEIERLREALGPFAEACCHLHPAIPDDGETLDGFNVSDFRRARQALQQGQNNE